MALARPLPPLWQALLPALNAPLRPQVGLPLLQRLAQPFAALAPPTLSLPSFPSLSEIWDGILKAVPKKKTSHRKKRQRFMAGKGLKDLINLGRCSSCGRVKRAHILCPYCVHAVQTKFMGMLTWFQLNPQGSKKWQRHVKREDIENRRFGRALSTKPKEFEPKGKNSHEK